MAPHAKARKAAVVLSSSDDSSDDDADPPTSPPARPRGKQPKAAPGSPVPNKGTTRPSQIINNDQAEKASRRRQSAHFVAPDVNANGSSGSSSPAGVSSAALKRVQQGDKKRRLSAITGTAMGAEQLQQPQESMEVMTGKFEEWMKMATDNKITVNNTWNFALIDYFADLTLLRNGPEDQTINFQKASCTLDGCVKIWTSRVDSVATETGKLLSGLTETGGAGDADDDGDQNEDGEDDGEEGGEGNGKKKRKTSAKTSTLATSFSSLSTKKLDLEATVDPLFKKTCADFDEGGAMGLLMNHLGVDGDGKLVFDAGDAGLDDGEEEEEPASKTAKVNVSSLKSKYLPALDSVLEREISSTLSTFVFSSTDSSLSFDFSNLTNPSDIKAVTSSSGNDVPNGFDATDGPGKHDFFAGDDDGFEFGLHDNDWAGAEGGDDGDDGGDSGGERGSHEAFNPLKRPNERDLVMAMVGAGGGDETGEMFDYFDRNLLGKNWAGPEHWKMQRLPPKKADPSTAVAKSSKAKAAAFSIDFTSPEPAVPLETLFEPAGKTSITLPSAKKAAPTGKKRISLKKKEKEPQQDLWLLPDDLHFSSQQLLRLFTKKQFTLRMRKQDSDRFNSTRGDGEVDEQFWSNAAAEQADAQTGIDPDDYETEGMPFDTQFFHDDGGFGGALDPDSGSEAGGEELPEDESLWAGTQGLKRSRPDYVKYTKRAKRVDVKRLKESIWKGLEIFAPPMEGEEEDEDPVPPPPPDAPPADPRVFSSVVDSLQNAYPSDKLSDISTSYCFICLLHLCNERGLRIESARGAPLRGEVFDDDEGTDLAIEDAGLVEEKTVGELGWLKISKDGDAKGHA